MPISIAQKRAEFRKLHESGCFVLPNPWDVGSARLLAGMGFKALASTSSGFAWSTGRPDNDLPVEQVLDHLKMINDATDLPLNADFEAGFADDPADVAANVTRGVATGVAGLSIEDSTGDAKQPLYEMKLAVERMQAARAAIDATKQDVMLIGRCESFLIGQPDLNATIARLTAYAEAGADCLYAPGIKTKEQIVAVVKAVAPKPVNLLMGAPGMSVAEIADLGVRRISVGGAMARAAWGAFLRASRDIAQNGSFTEFAHAVSYAEINGMFGGEPF
ncbi:MULTISPECIES: isocitrate lyase/phosphoenolpyruvate mutase family protein [unclassified Afipia]|uniref:isocitrate lyase/PEP mutase family protein n=1 Tax=unclassified Afipia TaxID=2642050 RepID=UPI000400749C|nr:MULTISPECIES: isocitrate lyase/phosphoenolpyruvate mutase family protein [unclassified Afipia]